MLGRRVLQWIIFVLLWMLLVFQTDRQNLVAAAIAGLLTVMGIGIASRHLQERFSVPVGWAAALARVPWQIITDTGRVFAALFRQMIRRDRAVGQLVSIPFDYGSRNAEDSARLAITLFGVSITPNTVPITTAPDSILLHQLAPAPEPVERRDPRWPV